jgi:hypothetical protein
MNTIANLVAAGLALYSLRRWPVQHRWAWATGGVLFFLLFLRSFLGGGWIMWYAWGSPDQAFWSFLTMLCIIRAGAVNAPPSIKESVDA